jgi:hypothetical protein
MGVGGQRHAPVALPQGKWPRTHYIEACVCPRAGLDGCGKPRPTGIQSPDRPASSESLHPGPHWGLRKQKLPCKLSKPWLLVVVIFFPTQLTKSQSTYIGRRRTSIRSTCTRTSGVCRPVPVALYETCNRNASLFILKRQCNSYAYLSKRKNQVFSWSF